jgi:hypothetical protein
LSAAANLARLKRLKEQVERGGQVADAALASAIRRAEDLTDVGGGGAGKPGEVHRVANAEHAPECQCAECDTNRAAVGVDCGEFEHGTRYREAVFVTKGGQRFQSRRATDAEPGASDDWLVAPAPPPPARASTKAKAAPPMWARVIVEEITAWCVAKFARADRVADLERRLLETKAGGAGSGAAELGDVEARIAALENEVAVLKQKHVAAPDVATLADCHIGVHRPGLEAKRGQICTFHGGAWLCLKDTTGTPAESPDWRLIIKAGRPGRDAKGER